MYSYEDNQLYEIIPKHIEEPKKKKKIFSNAFLKSAVAFVLGAGITFGAVSVTLPEMVNKQLASRITYSQRESTPKGDKNPQASSVVAKSGQLTIVEIAKRVGPTVVGINTKVRSTSIFGTMQESQGSGSGIILTSDGYIVTNNHVIEGASSVSVVLNDGQIGRAHV